MIGINKKEFYKVYFVRRLLKSDKDDILKAYSYLNKTFFNPVDDEFVENIFLKGEFWGVFLKEELIAATWLFKASEEFYKNSNEYWNIKDILNEDLEDVFICGYIYNKNQSEEIYALFLNLFNMQSIKQNKKTLIHLLRAQEYNFIQPIFKEKFQLMALRGIENITPHYVFKRESGFKNKEDEKNTYKKVNIQNTKEISKLLEKGHIGYKLEDEKIHFLKP